MMSYLINAATPPELASQHWILTGNIGIYLGDGYSPVPEGAIIIEQDGVVLDQAEYLAIRPLGNEEGKATDQLNYQHFAGAARRVMNLAATDPVVRAYPEDNLPFAIEVRHKLFTGNANPVWDGWGWRAEIVGGAASRDPAARAIGIYSDPECLNYLYTTGAFTQQPSAWQTDAAGVPLIVWATEYNPGLLGYPNDIPQDVHHACLLGSAQEGYATLGAMQVSAYHEFWEHDQGYVSAPVATWIDTGATIKSQAGTAYQLTAVVSGLAIGQPLRLGDTAETTFAGYWPTPSTPSDYILISPFVQVALNLKVWKWA